NFPLVLVDLDVARQNPRAAQPLLQIQRRTTENSIDAIVKAIAEDMYFNFVCRAGIEQTDKSFIHFDRVEQIINLIPRGAYELHLFRKTFTRSDSSRASCREREERR